MAGICAAGGGGASVWAIRAAGTADVGSGGMIDTAVVFVCVDRSRIVVIGTADAWTGLGAVTAGELAVPVRGSPPVSAVADAVAALPALDVS